MTSAQAGWRSKRMERSPSSSRPSVTTIAARLLRRPRVTWPGAAHAPGSNGYRPAGPGGYENGPASPVGGTVGTLAPPFALPGVHGEMQTLEALCAGGRPVILLFVDPANRGNRRLVREVTDVLRRRASAVTVAAVASGFPGDGLYDDELGSLPLLADTDGGVAEAYGVGAVPAAVLVGSDGAIGSSIAVGATTIRRLVDLAAAFPRAYPTSGQQTAAAAHRPDDPCHGCLDTCRRRGGGNACEVVCRATGPCAKPGPTGV